MTPRRLLGAAAVAAAILVSGCSSATDGSAERGASVSSATGDTAGDSADSTATSMTQPSGGAGVTTASPAGSGTPTTTSSAAATSETHATTTETAGATRGTCSDVSSWTTADETTDLAGNAPIVEVSADAADCYDQFVITLGPDAHDPGYRVRYVDTVTEDGSGRAVQLAGSANLEVIIDSPAYDPETGRGTLQIPDHGNVVDVSDFDALRQVAYAGSFEGQTTFGIGVADELPFAVTTDVDSDGNATLTVAVAHG